ncbi:MAG: asparagine synthase-related protein [Flavobacteriaceae bacterium]|nr:asparagine synthase-related protein [Flavobacteriaceae bacterium]
MINEVDWKRYNNLGFHAPFYKKNNQNYLFSHAYNDFINSECNLDLTAVSQLVNFNYILNDRTILQGVKKSPFLGNFNPKKNIFEFDKILFEAKNEDAIKIAKTLYKKLQVEMLSYISTKKNIGILLSGGMDSRIVLGILNSLIKENKTAKNIQIKAFTWGVKDSRDVIYAKKIADKYNINLAHFEVDEELFNKNIEYVLNNGLEFTPIHLHAMLKIANDKDVDCIIAGSYGDSIGRSQYSGKKISNLISHTDRLKNTGKLINPKVYSKTIKDSINDIEIYKKAFLQKEKIQNIELEYQIHYMRKMLNPALMSIQKKIPLYQMFASQEVYTYMWQFSPSARRQDIYLELFKLLDNKLLEIPYAKTGLIYGNNTGTTDNHKKENHIYTKQIKLYYKNYIEKKLLQSNFVDYGIMNKSLIKVAIKGMHYFNPKKNIFYEDKLLWFAILAEFLKKNKINVNTTKNSVNISSIFEYIVRKNIMN